MVDWSSFCEEGFARSRHPEIPGGIHVPRPPRALAEFLRIANSADVNFDELSGLIQYDPELTAGLLRAVNSSQSSTQLHVCSVRHAIGLLGVRRTTMLVLKTALDGALRKANPGVNRGDAFSTECLERAMFARETANMLGHDSDVAYVATLLQDLLLPYLQNAYQEEYALFDPVQQSLVEFERETFGWDHGLVAARALRNWMLPDEVVSCVMYHHDLDWVMSSDELSASTIVPIVLAALLPDTTGQEPEGIRKLVDAAAKWNDFNYLEVAALVDEHLAGLGHVSRNGSTLCERLSNLLIAHVERQREEEVWRIQRIGSYTLEELLGQGGMGVVFRGRHDLLRRHAAVKLMKSSQLDARAIENFEAEAQITSELDSPHTIDVYDYGVTSNGVLYLVMEMLVGSTFRELVRKTGPLPQGRVIHLMRQVCLSLAEAHSHKLIHRDLKPENIFVSNRGGVADFVKVLDFGLATVVTQQSSGNTGSQGISGTPQFMPPEAILTPGEVDERADIYSLGAVMYFLLTGENLFPSSDVRTVLRQQLKTMPERPSARLGRVLDHDLEAIVMQCLEKDPNNRPANARQLRSMLSNCAVAGSWTDDDAWAWWAEFTASEDENVEPEVRERGPQTDDSSHDRTTYVGVVR